MIENVDIHNFRSVRASGVRLSPLTVLVGANGSGKSNFVKALQFVSSIPRLGLDEGVYHLGGFSEIIPKSIPQSSIRSASFMLRYACRLHSPPRYPKNLPLPSVCYSLQCGYGDNNSARIQREVIDFDCVLEVADLVRSEKGQEKEYPQLHVPSQLSIIQERNGHLKFKTNFRLDRDNTSLLLEWLGYTFLGSQITTSRQFKELFDAARQIWRGELGSSDDHPKRATKSLLDPYTPTFIDHSEQFQVFRRQLTRTRRFDLLIHELRQEQQHSNSGQPLTDGRYIPSALRRLLDLKSQDKARDRIINTLAEIAPHVVMPIVKQLGSSKEFVEFIEQGEGRHVESWETSDGTLRALAILVCIETHPEHTTILLEEPERDLHPWAVGSLMRHIRKTMAERDLQVILTTHSPQVLEEAEAHEVIVAIRSTDEGTVLKRLSDMYAGKRFAMGDIGRLWVKGLIGGVPEND